MLIWVVLPHTAGPSISTFASLVELVALKLRPINAFQLASLLVVNVGTIILVLKITQHAIVEMELLIQVQRLDVMEVMVARIAWMYTP